MVRTNESSVKLAGFTINVQNQFIYTSNALSEELRK